MPGTSDPNSAIQFFQTRMPDGTVRVLLFEKSPNAARNIGDALAFVIDFSTSVIGGFIDSATIANYVRDNQATLSQNFQRAKELGKATPLVGELSTKLGLLTAGFSLVVDLNGDMNLKTDAGILAGTAGSMVKFFYSVGASVAIGEIVLASTAFGAAFGPVGAGVGLLGGLLFAGAASFAVATSANNIKSAVTNLLTPVENSLRNGGDIIVNAPIALDADSRIGIYDPAQLATNPALRAAVDGLRSDSGPLADYISGRSSTLNVPGLGGVARSVANNRETITLTAQGFSYSEILPIGASEQDVNAAINGLRTRISVDIEKNLQTAPDVGTYSSVSTLGALFGSTLGRYIGGANPLASVLTSSVLGTITQNLGQAIVVGGFDRPVILRTGAGRDINAVTQVADNVLDDFGSELINNLRSAAIGTVSSLLAVELGNVLGIKGFGGELLTTGASSVIGQVASNAFNIAQYGSATPGLVGQAGDAGQNLFHGLDSQGLFGSVDKAGVAQPGLLTGAIGSYFGAKLGSLILAPVNTEGAVLSSLGSAAGVFALTSGATSLGIGSFAASLTTAFGSIANIAVPFVGSLVGFLLGSLIGRLFGRRRPRVPSANAEIALNIGTGRWDLGSITAANNGNRQLVSAMASTARDGINSLISVIAATDDQALVSNTIEERQRYGHTGNTLYFDEKVGGTFVRRYSGSSADSATELGILAGIQATKLVGGNIFLKRAVYGVATDDVATMVGNMQVADDFSKYLANPQPINQLMAQAPTSSFAAGWAITLLRAEELGLNQYRPSDFFGGLKGFASSFGIDQAAGGLEALQLSWEGPNLRIGATDGSSPFQAIAFNNFAYAGQSRLDAGRSAIIENFGTNVGYTPWSGQATAGNDIWIAAGGGPVTMDDSAYEYSGYWYYDYGMNDYLWMDTSTYVSGGDDIFVGSSYNDVLYGNSGWDWLDGGEGEDLIDGGENSDVLMGRGGNDRMLGGEGNDYLAGGEGDDYFYDSERTWGLYGGTGDDVLVGGGGSDALYGESGNDLIIVDQDGGGVWDALTGGDGEDTLSYERFNSGVYVDFASLGGWAWDPQAKYIYGDAISGVENVTGTGFNDVVYADAGANLLHGLVGADYLNGREGDDILAGGIGADTLDGGSGLDSVSYEDAVERVSVDLTAGKGFLGEAEGDLFLGIENGIGSIFSDVMKGDAGDNVLRGLNGDDQFVLTGGTDTIDGGAGVDTLDASGASGALTVYYDPGYYDPYYGYFYEGAGLSASVVGVSSSLLTGIERFVGTSFDDLISGSDGDEIFEGAAGNDNLIGGLGADTFVLGRGDGQDSISDYGDSSNGILLRNGINWRDISISGANYAQQGGNLVVTIRDTSDQAIVGGNFSYVNSGSNAGNHNHAIKTIDLAGAGAIEIDTVDWTPYAADDSSTVVYGAQNLSDMIFAYAGDDTIYAAGDSYSYESRGNVIYAGDGYDVIYASFGDDQYVYERGNAVDTVNDSGGVDTIVMGPTVAADDVVFEVVKTFGNGEYGSDADLYIGLRDPDRPDALAYQLSDHIRIASGGVKLIGMNSGAEQLNTIEHIRVGGQEIDLTKANIDWAVSYYYDGGYYPIALDLDGDGIELRSVEGSRITTVEADGTVTRMGWLGQDDGFLALDRDGNGVIDRIGEISFVGDKEGAETDLEGLTAYDGNGDGKLDASDARWGEFKVWQDKNQDGFGSEKELVGLDEAGVSSISLRGQLTGFTAQDGPDNAVIATTDVIWKDASRIGRGYDVMLARLQVRTDDAGRGLADMDAKARGKKADDIDAKLRGIQTLTPEQAAAIRDKKARQSDSGEGGRFYRVEDLLGSGSAKVVDGIYSIDPKLAKTIADGGRKLGLIDQFGDSEWTKLGSTKLGEADVRGADVLFRKSDLSDSQREIIADARKLVADRKVADRSKATERAAKDASDAVLRPAPMPPTVDEMERLKKKDKFQLLESEIDGETDSTMDTDASVLQQLEEAALADGSGQPPIDEVEISKTDKGSADVDSRSQPVQALSQATDADTSFQQAVQEGSGGPEVEAYSVVIRAANARLVQALASFGDAPMMMANYQGLNVANDPQAWLSVDAMPSVQRFATVR